MSVTQYMHLTNEREIVKYFLEKKAISPNSALDEKILINDNVNILSPSFAQLHFFGVIMEAKKGAFYLNIENLKRYQKYMFLHTFSYSSIFAVLVLLVLVIVLQTFNITLFLIALGISMLSFLPPSLIVYRRYSFPELKEFQTEKKVKERS